MTRRSRLLLALVAALAIAQAPAVANAACPLVAQAGPAVCSPGSKEELNQVLRSPYTGRIVIPHDVSWDMTGLAGPDNAIPVPSGVELVGERGKLGSRPLLYTRDEREHALFEVDGHDVRIEGLHLQGPSGRPDANQQNVTAIEVDEEPGTLGQRVVIADNEINNWPGQGVNVYGRLDFVSPPANYNGPRMRPSDVGLVRIERNYIHHNARDSRGYGVALYHSAYATIEGNVFDFNRHAVASDGHAFNGYTARFNYVLEGGFTYDGDYTQHFDVHGVGADGFGGAAGEAYHISGNTIRGEQDYGLAGHKTRPAFQLRGKPASGAWFEDNVLVHDDSGEAISLEGLGHFTDDGDYRFHRSGNEYDSDYTRQIQAGEFDGDGRTDVFLATGTAWFFSRGGVRPWELLHISDKRAKDLGFADIDNDGITDVVYRDGAGRLGFLKGGRGGLVPLNTSTPVPMKDIRFGDFDGDKRTDIFYTQNKQWYISYGRSLPRRFVKAQTSVSPINELIFGEFDGVKGTDVAAVQNKGWSYSSAGEGSYTKFNGKLTDSFASARGVDVDGNGKTDVVFSDGRWSRDGRGPLGRLFNTGSGLANWVSGHFDGGPRTEVITWNSAGLQLVIARVPDRKTFVRQSAQPMR